jgi:hypothetical integral membrane protein (TIGR02206 family)
MLIYIEANAMIFQYFWKHEINLPKGIGNNLGWQYLVTIALMLVAFVLLILIYRKMSAKHRKRLMIALAIMMPLLEISRIIWKLAVGQFYTAEDLPLQICRIMLFLQPIAILTQNAKLKTFCYTFGLPGALLAFVMPTFGNYPIMSFFYLRYIICHFVLALVPLLWVFGDKFRPRVKLWVLLTAVLALGVVMFGANVLIGSNYFYVNYLPTHVNINLPQPWHFIVMVSFMMAIVTITILPFLLRKKEPAL